MGPLQQQQPQPQPQPLQTTTSWLLWRFAVLLPLLLAPRTCLLNRGYTQWFHWNALLYCCCGCCWHSNSNSATARQLHDWHVQFLALQGLTVTLGWYASLLLDWMRHDRFGHVLYWNMPTVLTQYMLLSSSSEGEGNVTVICDTWSSVGAKLLSHTLDTLGHPLLTLYFWNSVWRQRQQQQSSDTTQKTTCLLRYLLSTVGSWSILCGTYALSRTWSVVHTWYNHGQPSLFYIGYDVYTIHDDDPQRLPGLWLPAYVTEGVVYVAIIALKLLVQYTWSSTRRDQLHSKWTPTTTTTLPQKERVPFRSASSVSLEDIPPNATTAT